MDKEKEIEEMAKVLYGHYCGKDECGKCKMPNCGEYRRAEYLYNAGYRKTEEVTLKLDLGDRTPEEIKRITEQLREAMSKTPTVITCFSKEEIRKQIAQEIYVQILQVEYRFNLPEDIKVDVFGGALLNTALDEMQSDLLDQFNKIFKKYGVEIEE